MMTPWDPKGDKDRSMLKIKQAPTVQFDFSGVLQPDWQPFEDEQCVVFGYANTTIRIQLCVDGNAGSNNLRAGMNTVASPRIHGRRGIREVMLSYVGLFICNGTEGGLTWYSFGRSLNMTTHVSLYTREATTVVSHKLFHHECSRDFCKLCPSHLSVCRITFLDADTRLLSASCLIAPQADCRLQRHCLPGRPRLAPQLYGRRDSSVTHDRTHFLVCGCRVCLWAGILRHPDTKLPERSCLPLLPLQCQQLRQPRYGV